VIFSASGIPNAAVFHVPVSACHIMFLSHSNSRGIAFSWMGEGVSNHLSESIFRVSSQIPKALNFSTFVKIIINNVIKVMRL